MQIRYALFSVKKIMLPLCLLLIAGQSVSQQDNRFLPPPQALHVSSGTYKAEFQTRKVDIPESESESWWGTDRGVKGAYQIAELKIVHKGHEITVPKSAYADLLWPWKLQIIPNRDGCKLRIAGSDAVGFYTCVIYVKHDKVTERTVHGGEFPENNEVTYYRYLNPKDVD